MESEEATLRRQARQREYYLKHRDKMLAYSRKYIQEHPEKMKLYKENAAKKRENGTGYYQRYYQRNKEKLLENSKRWFKNHPEKVKEYQRRYYQKKRAAAKKEKKIMLNPDIDKAKALFRDPSKAAHLQWILEHNRNKFNQYESR
nr:MAG TPA: hypothetical protein [Caudoviricetes sp.]